MGRLTTRKEKRSMKTKQAWKTFLSSNGEDCNIAIHCDTEEKAKKLLKYLHKKGFTWYGGTSLTEKINWLEYKNETCYTSEVMFCNREYFIEDNFKILSFNDIEKYIDKKKKVTLKKYSKTYKDFDENFCEKIKDGCRTCKLSCNNNEKGCGCRDLLIEYPYTAYKLMKKMLKEHKENEDC